MNMKLLRILGKRRRITIPYEIMQRVGFVCNDVLSFTESEDGRSVVIRREKLCPLSPTAQADWPALLRILRQTCRMMSRF